MPIFCYSAATLQNTPLPTCSEGRPLTYRHRKLDIQGKAPSSMTRLSLIIFFRLLIAPIIYRFLELYEFIRLSRMIFGQIHRDTKSAPIFMQDWLRNKRLFALRILDLAKNILFCCSLYFINYPHYFRNLRLVLKGQSLPFFFFTLFHLFNSFVFLFFQRFFSLPTCYLHFYWGNQSMRQRFVFFFIFYIVFP